MLPMSAKSWIFLVCLVLQSSTFAVPTVSELEARFKAVIGKSPSIVDRVIAELEVIKLEESYSERMASAIPLGITLSQAQCQALVRALVWQDSSWRLPDMPKYTSPSLLEVIYWCKTNNEADLAVVKEVTKQVSEQVQVRKESAEKAAAMERWAAMPLYDKIMVAVNQERKQRTEQGLPADGGYWWAQMNDYNYQREQARQQAQLDEATAYRNQQLWEMRYQNLELQRLRQAFENSVLTGFR